MPRTERLHVAYLIRLWRVRSKGRMVWRASLEDAHTGEKKGFGDPAGLLAFLQTKLDVKPDLTKDNDSSSSGPMNPKES